MKAIEILGESKINEAPVGMLRQVGRGLASKALGAVGLRTFANDFAGAQDEGDRANQYNELFRRYLAQAGKNLGSATYADVANFLKINKLNPAYVRGIRGPVIPKELDQIFIKMANDYFQGKSGPGEPATQGASGARAGSATQPSGQQTAQSGAQTGGQQAAPNNATGQTASQPFSIPALIQVIPQMSKRDLNKLNKAVQAALQNPRAAAQQARAAASSTSNATAGMTPAQTRAVRQAQAANVAQAQMKANPPPVRPAPVDYNVPAYKRQGKPAPTTASKKAVAV